MSLTGRMKILTDGPVPRLVTGPPPYLAYGGRKIPIDISRPARAARIKVRIDPRRGIVLLLPKRASLKAGLDFLHQEIDWITRNIKKLPAAVPFRDGAMLPLLGVPHRITHAPERRGLVWAEAGNIYVTGRPEHLPRRLNDWVRRSAKSEIADRAEGYARQVGKRYSGIVLRDQISRWGSCSSTGRLNFSWRLLLMPENVMSYIVAHEVAHLRHMNHSSAFWGLVDELHPGVAPAKNWLKTHGADLHKYGVERAEGV
ncbi:MAG: SprT family zinc-dependent metalloprotease [Sneathiella sp.]